VSARDGRPPRDSPVGLGGDSKDPACTSVLRQRTAVCRVGTAVPYGGTRVCPGMYPSMFFMSSGMSTDVPEYISNVPEYVFYVVDDIWNILRYVRRHTQRHPWTYRCMF
jgi:hypothetical protein